MEQRIRDVPVSAAGTQQVRELGQNPDPRNRVDFPSAHGNVTRRVRNSPTRRWHQYDQRNQATGDEQTIVDDIARNPSHRPPSAGLDAQWRLLRKQRAVCANGGVDWVRPNVSRPTPAANSPAASMVHRGEAAINRSDRRGLPRPRHCSSMVATPVPSLAPACAGRVVLHDHGDGCHVRIHYPAAKLLLTLPLSVSSPARSLQPKPRRPREHGDVRAVLTTRCNTTGYAWRRIETRTA